MNDIVFLTAPTLACVGLVTTIIAFLACGFGYQKGRNDERDKPR